MPGKGNATRVVIRLKNDTGSGCYLGGKEKLGGYTNLKPARSSGNRKKKQTSEKKRKKQKKERIRRRCTLKMPFPGGTNPARQINLRGWTRDGSSGEKPTDDNWCEKIESGNRKTRGKVQPLFRCLFLIPPGKLELQGL